MTSEPNTLKAKTHRPFRAAIFRGLGILAPPLLTIVIFVWIGMTVQNYVLRPVTSAVREVIVAQLRDVREGLPLAPGGQRVAEVNGLLYTRLDNGQFIPSDIYEAVRKQPSSGAAPTNADDYYRRYVDLTYLRPWIVLPLFLAGFLTVLYLLGKFLAAGIGRALWNLFEQIITRLPLVRSVYSAVKQFSDFFFSDTDVQFTRVVAIEYPRKGLWSLAFVVSESFLDIRAAANEDVVALFVPTSPMPMAGFATTALKREIIDLNITIDQAIQFIVSCGVVAPPYKIEELGELAGQRATELIGGPASER